MNDIAAPGPDQRSSRAGLAELAARAASLTERLRGDVVPVSSTADDSTIASRLERWRHAVGGADALSMRLALDHLDESKVSPLLGTVHWPENHPLPPWTQTLQAILDLSCPPRPAPRALPFADLLHPFAEWGRRELHRRAGADLDVLSAAAQDDLAEELLQGLSTLSSFALGKHFQLHRALRNPLELFLDAPAEEGAYDRFAAAMRAGGLADFFREYPVLGRLLVEHVERWAGNHAQFLRRLRDDLPAIASTFGRTPGVVARLQPRLSDPHNGGHSVIVLVYDSWSLVYKPKNLGTDAAFFALLAWLGERGAPLATLRVLGRGSYGWVEHAGHSGCADEAAVRRYYRRAGMLLCAVWALGGTDCHHENLIAAGEQPVLVDTETLLYRRPQSPDAEPGSESADQLASEASAETVFANGLLPVWIIGANGRSYDLSGFAADEDQRTGTRVLDWGADGMAPAEREAKVRRGANLPLLGGEPQPPRAYVEEIVAGFGEMHRCLLRNREALLAEDGPLARFEPCVVRYVARPTQIYGNLLMRLRHPDLLRDGADRAIELEVLARALLKSEQSPERGWPIFEAERRAIAREDVPFFTANHTDGALRAEGEVLIADFFGTSALAAARERLVRMAPDDLDLHAAHIRAAFDARYDVPGRRPAVPSDEVEDAQPLSAGELIEAAREIAYTIEKQALRGRDGSVTWLTFDVDAASERWRPGPMGNTLYAGRSGVALFLAALASATGERAYRDLALAALRPLRRAVAHSATARGLLGIGGAAGAGGMIYALARIGRFLGDEELVRDAGVLAGWITEEQVAADHQLDVIGGAAGCILGLLALTGTELHDAALDRASVCARHLLDKRQPAWQTAIASRPLTGFSHGVAGIAYTLLRLARETGDRRLVDAAAEAIAYEDSLFDEEHQNWPDLRDDHAHITGYATTWCHGAPGIGLARLGAIDVLSTPEILRDIDRALATTRASAFTAPDHLCCGALGKLELVIQAGAFDEAQRAAAAIIRRAGREGRYRLNTTFAETARVPSLFQGTSGIGYQLLRLTAPSRFPAVLLWE
ncbi:MAG TPA: type 2 lanthipeptide synthetase LanM family protein [Thermoanaerobaculia bacterium]